MKIQLELIEIKIFNFVIVSVEATPIFQFSSYRAIGLQDGSTSGRQTITEHENNSGLDHNLMHRYSSLQVGKETLHWRNSSN